LRWGVSHKRALFHIGRALFGETVGKDEMTAIYGTAFQHPSDDGARHIANADERDFAHE
jgi:hypothetical protein